MNPFSKLTIALKAARQLGLRQVGLYALYKFGLLTGHYRRVTSRIENCEWEGTINHSLFTSPSRADLETVLGADGKSALLAEADEIVGGKARLFGAEPVELVLALPGKLAHWTAYETGKVPLPINQLPISDIKFLWEPARFGWAFTLGRAYHLTGDERYAETFWRNFEIFTDANPPCLGPHWMSGQEVALRLMAFVWAAQAFDAAPASTPERKRRLAVSVAAHAARIPPTLVYARAQHNNHLLTEVAGLFTAGLALPDHPDAPRWRGLGWRWLNHGLQSQIDSYGEYSQHSTNYHRLILQVVLWTNALARKFDLRGSPGSSTGRWPRQTMEAVGRSVHWLLSLMDSESGRTPNLGANDGAYIFPLTVLPFADYRPVLHAAARAFLDYDLPRGPWDEMALWFGVQVLGPKTLELPRYLGDQLYGKQSWAYFRTAQYTSRPSHADQLHLDLWWRGLNVAQDAGTYLYNAPAPWNNSLTTAFVHNTLTVNGRDQMRRAGRFLYLDWVNAYRRGLPVEESGELQRVRGRYRGGGYRHTRIVSVFEDDRWRVVDELLPLRMFGQNRPLTARLHWLLPDWEWKIVKSESKFVIRLKSLFGWVTIGMDSRPPVTNNELQISLVRAGELLLGSAPSDPTRGWTSPTYGVKIPALSLAIIAESPGEIVFSTEFAFAPVANR
ncbi:MAG: alginate lyase family protein [Chloroflexi bacterium]|nr:alginate lyase family protein [Chloroflexota bacterium]